MTKIVTLLTITYLRVLQFNDYFSFLTIIGWWGVKEKWSIFDEFSKSVVRTKSNELL